LIRPQLRPQTDPIHAAVNLHHGVTNFVPPSVDRGASEGPPGPVVHGSVVELGLKDRKSTRLNSSHGSISYAVFCLKKKKTETPFGINRSQINTNNLEDTEHCHFRRTQRIFTDISSKVAIDELHRRRFSIYQNSVIP